MAQPNNPAAQAAAALIGRILPGHATDFTIEIIPQENGRDVFEIESPDGRIHLRGNNGLAVAVAFNWYLRHTVKANFDWQAIAPLEIQGKLPRPTEKIRQACLAKERFFLNYCTYGYSMPWWDWSQWQRFIDWMAMNGINRPLMQAGLEATWLEVWKSYGLEPDSIRAYFGSPAHLAWHRMANHDKWDHPLPLSYIDGQMKLQKQILERSRALGMKPILSGFAGHVPEMLIKIKPDAKISQIKPGWGGMDAQYATWFLAPTDPLFQEIQARFLKKQAEMYGTDHLYGADPFNEMSPPSWEPDYLASVAKTIYESMAAADPDAVWYQMSWTFRHMRKDWTPPRLAAMTNAVPKGRLVYLDYVVEESEFYRGSNNCHGAPFLYCYLANFGGNTHVVAPVKKVSGKLPTVLALSNCIGIGGTLEGINVNPFAYELLLEQPWHENATLKPETWFSDYADSRAGRPDPAVRNAWKILLENVFVNNAVGIGGHGIALQAHPRLGKGMDRWADSFIPYKQKDLISAVEQLFKADPACRRSDGYQFDVVNLTRQALGNHSSVLRDRMLDAFKAKDLAAFRRESAQFLELGRDLDTLLGTRHEFLLGTWIANARRWDNNPAEQALYERNARQILTTWHRPGSRLTDYANRQWNGMMKTYYLPRWETFIRLMDESLVQNKPLDQAAFDGWCVQFEGNWVEVTGEKFSTVSQGDPCETAERLYHKYCSALAPDGRLK